jgi:hypothetical protein
VPIELWRRAARGEHILLISPEVICELARVLREDLKWPQQDIIAQLKLVVRVAKLIEPKLTLEVVAAGRFAENSGTVTQQ